MNMLEILSGMCYSEKDRGNSPVSIDRYFKGTSRFTKGTLQAIHLKPQETWNCPGNNTGSGTASSCAACVGKRSRL